MKKVEQLKSDPRVTYRAATQADLDAIAPEPVKCSFKALAFFLDGELAGVSGLKFVNSYYVAFLDIKPNLPVTRMTIWRCTLEVMKMVRETTPICLATADKNVESSERFLKRLGFAIMNDEERGYLWRN